MYKGDMWSSSVLAAKKMARQLDIGPETTDRYQYTADRSESPPCKKEHGRPSPSCS